MFVNNNVSLTMCSNCIVSTHHLIAFSPPAKLKIFVNYSSSLWWWSEMMRVHYFARMIVTNGFSHPHMFQTNTSCLLYLPGAILSYLPGVRLPYLPGAYLPYLPGAYFPGSHLHNTHSIYINYLPFLSDTHLHPKFINITYLVHNFLTYPALTCHTYLGLI